MKTKRRIRKPTPIPVRFGPDELSLFRLIAARADAQSRSISGQLKHYARLGLITEDNPDLPLSFIEGILEAQAEFRAGLGLPYRWGVLNGHPGPVPGPGPAPDSAPGGPGTRMIQLEDE